MIKMNGDLDAAINALNAHPGTSPDQVAQLRAMILSDTALASRLGEHAAAGRLNGFAVASAGADGAAAGSFDPVSGVMTLPATSLEAGGSDLAGAVRLQEAVLKFANTPYPAGAKHAAPPTPEMIRNLETVINESPYLAQSAKRQASERDPGDPGRYYLEEFAILPADKGAGGSFDRVGHTMHIPADALLKNSPSAPKGYFEPDNLTFMIGHELQHGLNHRDLNIAQAALEDSAMAVGKSKNRTHDYTDVVGNYVAACRVDEAKAEISGWNALISRKQQFDPTFKWEDMVGTTGQVLDFVARDDDTHAVTVREGIKFEPDGSLAHSAGNIEALGRSYFDRPAEKYAQVGDRAMHLGYANAGDYRAHYSRSAINVVIQVEDNARTVRGVHSVPQIDMKKLGLHEDLIEQQGLDLGKNTTPRLYLDSSDTPASRHYFDHTIKNSDHPFQYVPDPPAAEMTSSLHRELKDLLPDGTSSDRIAQIALSAKEGGIEAGRIRSLDLVGEKLMLTGATPGTSATIDLASAPPPAAQSNAQFAAVAEQQQQQQVQAQQQMSQQQSGPTMSMGR